MNMAELEALQEEAREEEIQEAGVITGDEPVITPQTETAAPATLQSVVDDLLETALALSTRLREGKKGLSPAAGASIKDVATAVGILQNQIFIKDGKFNG